MCQNLSDEEVATIFLLKLKENAEAYLGEKVNNAVFIVPASFDGERRQTIKRVGDNAGLNVKRIFNDP